MTLGRDCPHLPCEVAFTAEEWRAAWLLAKRQPPPATPPTLGEMIRLVAGFGGFLGRKRDGHPGPKALWEGLTKLMAYVEALQTVHEVYGFTSTCGEWGDSELGRLVQSSSVAGVDRLRASGGAGTGVLSPIGGVGHRGLTQRKQSPGKPGRFS